MPFSCFIERVYFEFHSSPLVCLTPILEDSIIMIYDCLLLFRDMRFSVFLFNAFSHRLSVWRLCYGTIRFKQPFTYIRDSININDETKTDKKTKHITCSPKLSTHCRCSMHANNVLGVKCRKSNANNNRMECK